MKQRVREFVRNIRKRNYQIRKRGSEAHSLVKQINNRVVKFCITAAGMFIAPHAANAYAITNAGGSDPSETITITNEATKNYTGDELTLFQETSVGSPNPGFAAIGRAHA